MIREKQPAKPEYGTMTQKKRSFKIEKKELIDFAFENLIPQPRSFADLGGVWDVDGEYSFFTLDRFQGVSGTLVDTDLTEKLHQRLKKNDLLRVVQGNFGDASVRDLVGRVDAVFLFDVLLHQVRPDWNQVLGMYAPTTDAFLVFNPQWEGPGRTVRLLDLGREEYLRHVPHGAHQPLYIEFFEKLDEIHPGYGRPWRDIHNVWQWGITDGDLIDRMEDLGFILRWSRDCGPFQSLPRFRSRAFLFQRREIELDRSFCLWEK